MAPIPFHLHPQRAELLARGPEMAREVLARAGRDGKPSGCLVDVDAALRVFSLLAEHEDVGGIRAAIVNDSHFFAYSVGPMWFNPLEPWLLEQFFMRVGRGSTSQALADIEQMGRDLGCKGVLMATSLAANDEALGRLLARFGYAPQSSQHYKDL